MFTSLTLDAVDDAVSAHTILEGSFGGEDAICLP